MTIQLIEIQYQISEVHFCVDKLQKYMFQKIHKICESKCSIIMDLSAPIDLKR